MEAIGIAILIVVGFIINYYLTAIDQITLMNELSAIDAKIDKFLVEISNLDDEIAQLRAYQEE